MYPILGDYNMPRPGMLPFIFPLCKIFEYEVQIPMGFLTRPGHPAINISDTHDRFQSQPFLAQLRYIQPGQINAVGLPAVALPRMETLPELPGDRGRQGCLHQHSVGAV